MALEEFSPLLVEAWRRSATETVAITVVSLEMARHLRYRLYKLRVAMRASNHPATALANRGSVTLLDLRSPEGSWQVLVGPADSGLDEALLSAGITLDDAPEL